MELVNFCQQLTEKEGIALFQGSQWLCLKLKDKSHRVSKHRGWDMDLSEVMTKSELLLQLGRLSQRIRFTGM